MIQREKILAAAVVTLLVLLAGRTFWGRYRDLVDDRERRVAAARQTLNEAKMALVRGQRAVERMQVWQEQSLPTDREVARSLYRTWLLEQCKQAGLTVDDVQPSQRSTVAPTQSAIGYTIAARGTLAATAKFLYAFYRSTMLQQITRLQLRPASGASQLSVTLTVEALILSGAAHDDKLPEGVSDRLARSSVDEYIDGIEGRNLLTVYRPPRPDPPPRTAREERPPPPKFDDAKFAFFSGTVQVNGRWQAWITVRTTGEVLRLYEGDEVNVGQFEGRVVSIGPRMIVVESDDQKLQVDLGENLRDGKTAGEPG
jgi:hypothetical protein